MKPAAALFFAVIGTALLLCISFTMSIGQPWLALGFGIAAILFIGFGFMYKAKQRKKAYPEGKKA